MMWEQGCGKAPKLKQPYRGNRNEQRHTRALCDGATMRVKSTLQSNTARGTCNSCTMCTTPCFRISCSDACRGFTRLKLRLAESSYRGPTTTIMRSFMSRDASIRTVLAGCEPIEHKSQVHPRTGRTSASRVLTTWANRPPQVRCAGATLFFEDGKLGQQNENSKLGKQHCNFMDLYGVVRMATGCPASLSRCASKSCHTQQQNINHTTASATARRGTLQPSATRKKLWVLRVPSNFWDRLFLALVYLAPGLISASAKRLRICGLLPRHMRNIHTDTSSCAPRNLALAQAWMEEAAPRGPSPAYPDGCMMLHVVGPRPPLDLISLHNTSTRTSGPRAPCTDCRLRRCNQHLSSPLKDFPPPAPWAPAFCLYSKNASDSGNEAWVAWERLAAIQRTGSTALHPRHQKIISTCGNKQASNVE